MFAQLRHDAGEDQVLRVFLEPRDVDHIHRPVLKAPEWQVARCAVIRDEALAAERDVGQPIPLAESPGQRRYVVEQRLVAAQRVQRDTVRLVWRVDARLGEWSAPRVHTTVAALADDCGDISMNDWGSAHIHRDTAALRAVEEGAKAGNTRVGDAPSLQKAPLEHRCAD